MNFVQAWGLCCDVSHTLRASNAPIWPELMCIAALLISFVLFFFILLYKRRTLLQK